MAENAEDLIFPLVFTFTAFAPIFLFCELGERISCAADEIYDEMNVKRILPFFLKISQTKIAIEGFGNIVCTRESFKNV